MMLGVSGIMNSSGEGGGAAPQGHQSGGASAGSSEVGGGATSIPGGFSEEDKAAAAARMEENERSVGGNRWPRQETMALIKIRSDMAVAFRDSSLKGPLWEDVSRKMAELGFERTAKKCKEKFENLYKYHKRTKEGRAAKPDGKTYRFFDQLEALESNAPQPVLGRPQPQPLSMVAPPPLSGNTNLPMLAVSISSPNPVNVAQNPAAAAAAAQSANNSTLFQPLLPPPTMNTTTTTSTYPPQSHTFQPSNLVFSNSSSSTSSDEDIQRRRGRKRKWKDFFERLMKDVIDKQEELQKKFLETLEKRERDRMAKEEAWRVQEMTRLNREHDLLVQERSIAAAKDAAVIQFLQKITEQQNLQIPISNANAPQMPMPMPMQVQVPENPPPPQQTTAPPPPPPTRPPAPTLAPVVETPTKVLDTPTIDNNGGENFIPASSSRWPKAEVQALIDLRTSLDLKYQENGPKGPLWEEISAAMAKLGYNRNPKRCKEKWENINKYFKKVKESNKKRPEDSKTCPYFHQLDALYRERTKTDASSNPGFIMKPDQNPMMPIMARPEQQWPLPQSQYLHQHQDSAPDDHGSENVDENDDDEGEDDDEDEGGNYEIVTNKQQSSTTNTNTVE
ncbi:trihelix transcription factor GT-2-like [Olea europaea var. sylvestris]|uniref:trihelix transcription factor GT-2-like n=1 Tax=Olea europaea var. sylvestris TaxID=158386 RepID=UPI000C1CFF51|nr:trihelix transcription factor GT-2-like [Olea europaea var. sylvestris]